MSGGSGGSVSRFCMLDKESCKIGMVPSVKGSEICDILVKLALRKKVNMGIAPYDCPRAINWWFAQLVSRGEISLADAARISGVNVSVRVFGGDKSEVPFEPFMDYVKRKRGDI
jgi:hypothetical protein